MSELLSVPILIGSVVSVLSSQAVGHGLDAVDGQERLAFPGL